MAIVAGGSRNIGAAIARLVAAEGATVVIGDLREDEGRALAEEIGGTAAFDRCLAVNVRGTFLGMRALAGPMTRAGGGSITGAEFVLDGGWTPGSSLDFFEQ